LIQNLKPKLIKTIRILYMKNYNVYEDDEKSVYDELATNHNIVVGNTISYITRNQQGYMKYKVVLDDRGEKVLETIKTYDDWMNDEPEDNYENQIN